MGASYRQFCPVAKAMEILDERWTMLIIREMVSGSQRFNDLRRGLPRMSPTLLSKRLQQLVKAGIVERRPDDVDVRYALTPAGKELEPVVMAVGAWGVRWIGELGDEDLDPKLLLWDMRRRMDLAMVPPGRTVLRFEFPGLQPQLRTWWLVITSDDVDVCDDDPGHEVTASVTSELRTLTRIWTGGLAWSDAVKSGALTVDGPAAVRRAVPTWFLRSAFATVPRP